MLLEIIFQYCEFEIEKILERKNCIVFFVGTFTQITQSL